MADGIFQPMTERLLATPAARAAFLADPLSMLEANGVNIRDPNVLNQLDLETDITDGRRFVDGSVASTNIVTLVM
jgi:hypothetical protein